MFRTRLDRPVKVVDVLPSVVVASREALVGVDRHSRAETQEFLPQKRSRLYGVAAALTHCPQGDLRRDGRGGGAAPNVMLSSQSITTAPTMAAALTCACRASAASPAAARTPPMTSGGAETEACDPDLFY